MKPILAIIVEDIPVASAHLKKMLEDNCPQVNVIAELASGKEARQFLPKLHYDLLFLDIEFNDDYNAFDLLAEIDVTGKHIVFTTAYDTYRKQASEANTIKYLLKPIQKEELIKAVERSMLIMIGKETIQNSQQTHKALSDGKIIVHQKGEALFLHPTNILYLSADGSYTSIYYMENDSLKTILSSHHLGWFSQVLPQKLFLRVHKKYIVNIDYAHSIRKNTLSLKANSHSSEVLISKDRKKEIMEAIALCKLGF